MSDQGLLVGESPVRDRQLNSIRLQVSHDVGLGVCLLARVLDQPLHLPRHSLEEGELREVAGLLPQLRVCAAHLQLREFRDLEHADNVEEEGLGGWGTGGQEEDVNVAVLVDPGDHVHEKVKE